MDGTEHSGEQGSWRDEERRRDRRRRVGGCLGCGGLGVVGTFVALSVILGSISTQLEGCDLSGLEIGADPGPGTESERLDVLVVPATGLDHRSEVTIASRAFAPDSVVGVAVCLQEADRLSWGVAVCDEAQGARYAVDGDGLLQATYRVPRTISVDGTTFDCAEAPGRCVLVAADAGDYDRSGGQPLTFAATGPAPPIAHPGERPQTDLLPVTATPAGPFAPETRVALAADGFQPGEPLLAAWCTTAFATEGPTACEPVDLDDAVAALMLRSTSTLGADALHADDEGRVHTTLAARASIDPYASDASVDCTGASARCWFVIAAAADTKRSAVLPYELTPR